MNNTHPQEFPCVFCKKVTGNVFTVMGQFVCFACWDTIAAIAVKAISLQLPEQQEPYNNPLSDRPEQRVLI